MFWRLEDLWQSPTGDVSHASNFRPAVRCHLPSKSIAPVWGDVAGWIGRRERQAGSRLVQSFMRSAIASPVTPRTAPEPSRCNAARI